MKVYPSEFEGQSIRRLYDEATETWWFSVVDVVQVLTQQADFQAARKYWNQLKRRLAAEGSQSVTDCHRLKLPAADGKSYLTYCATAPTLLRLAHSVPSAEWIQQRMAEQADRRQASTQQIKRAHGYPRTDYSLGTPALALLSPPMRPHPSRTGV